MVLPYGTHAEENSEIRKCRTYLYFFYKNRIMVPVLFLYYHRTDTVHYGIGRY